MAGSGGLVLMNRLKPFSGIEHLAVDGIHYASYDDTYDDLEKKIRYYLLHQDEREVIVSNARSHFPRFHTYAARFERILKDFNLT